MEDRYDKEVFHSKKFAVKVRILRVGEKHYFPRYKTTVRLILLNNPKAPLK